MCHSNKEGEIKAIELIFPSNHRTSIYSDTVSLSKRLFFTCAIVQVRKNDLYYGTTSTIESEPVAMTQYRTKHVTSIVSLPPRTSQTTKALFGTVSYNQEPRSAAGHHTPTAAKLVTFLLSGARPRFTSPHLALPYLNQTYLGPRPAKRRKGKEKEDTRKRERSRSV